MSEYENNSVLRERVFNVLVRCPLHVDAPLAKLSSAFFVCTVCRLAVYGACCNDGVCTLTAGHSGDHYSGEFHWKNDENP